MSAFGPKRTLITPSGTVDFIVTILLLNLRAAMRRREFITLLGGTAAAWPTSAYAQPAKLPTIGFLGTGAQSAWTHSTAACVQRLHQLGWLEGRTVAIEYRWAEGRPEPFTQIAAARARR